MPPNPDIIKPADEAVDEPPDEPTDYQGDVDQIIDPEEERP